MGLPSSLCQAGSSFSLKAAIEREGCSASPCHVRRPLCNTGSLCGSSDEVGAQVPAVVISRAGDPGQAPPLQPCCGCPVSGPPQRPLDVRTPVPPKVAQGAPQPRIRCVSALALTPRGPLSLSGRVSLLVERPAPAARG